MTTPPLPEQIELHRDRVGRRDEDFRIESAVECTFHSQPILWLNCVLKLPRINVLNGIRANACRQDVPITRVISLAMNQAINPKRKMRVMLLLSVLAILGSAYALLAQSNDLWKQRNDKGNRYEGVVPIPTGNPDLEVLALHGFLERFQGKVNLRVKFFLPNAAHVSIVGREIETRRQYWMEIKPSNWRAAAWNEFYPWPTGDVLTKEGIPSSNLGVVAKLAGGNVLLPAFVYHTTLSKNHQTCTLYLRSNKGLRSVQLTLSGNDVKSKPINVTSTLGKQAASVPFPALLNLASFKEGMIRVTITRELRDSTQKPPPHEYVLYYKPLG